MLTPIIPSSHLETFHAVFEQMPIGVGCVSLEGKWLFVNPELCEILQYSWQDFEHLTYQELTFPEDLAQDRTYFQRFQAKEITNASFEKRFLRKDGETVMVCLSISLVPDQSGHPSYFTMLFEDIEKRKQHEHDQKTLSLDEIAAREQAESLNEEMQVLQAITDRTLATMPLDDLFRSVLSQIRIIMNADNIAVLLVSEDHSCLTIRAVNGIEETVAQEVRIPVGQGFAGTIVASGRPLIIGESEAPVEILTSVLREQLQALLGVPLLVDGRILGVIHVGTKRSRIFTQQDIELFERVADRLAMAIERSLLDEQAKRAQQETAIYAHHVEQVNQTLQRFVSIVGHEFRTALTGILGFSELLKEAESEPKDVQDYANDISLDTHRLIRLINDLLDLDQMQQGKMKISLQFQPTDLIALLQRQITSARAITQAHAISFTHEPHMPLLEGDPDKLQQVIMNMLSNAIKYSPKGGDIRVSCCQENDGIHLRIQDQGTGLSPEALPHIFEPYNRAKTQTTKYIKGTGLGLSISKHLIELHGGSIWVESVLGQGSTFHITLPLTQTVPDGVK
jgi:PAS domain S-box-containing protein